uniref:Uncharacterized protein n=1 Tax=Arundo donax TaxID=35708 RepID=A0A0A9CGS3_ARUDO
MQIPPLTRWLEQPFHVTLISLTIALVCFFLGGFYFDRGLL